MHILGALTDRYSFQVIENKLKSGNNRMRANAVEAIDNIANKKIGKLLIPLLDGTEMHDCIEIAKSNWDIKFNENPQEVILYKLNGTNQWQKACALYAVGELADSRYLDFVKKSVNSKDKYVEEAAREALRKIQQSYQLDKKIS